VIRGPRGGPGQFDARLARAEHLLATGGPATAPLTALVAVLHHQRRRATAPEIAAPVDRLVAGGAARRSAGTFPSLDLDGSFGVVAAEVTRAVREIDGEHLPAALRDSGHDLTSTTSHEQAEQIATWFDDPAVVAPLVAFWFRVAAGVMVELAAALVGAPTSDTWQGMSCPVCGAAAQASVIAEESGEFMGGSPRNLVCSRCATWWSFPRVACPACGQTDPRSIHGFRVSENPVVRVDCCETCHGYVKTFDLRQADARDVVPIVDDVATLSLDLWVQARGFQRASISFAGA
jgi:formate dehydrogenase accessory protein FdhE